MRPCAIEADCRASRAFSSLVVVVVHCYNQFCPAHSTIITEDDDCSLERIITWITIIKLSSVSYVREIFRHISSSIQPIFVLVLSILLYLCVWWLTVTLYVAWVALKASFSCKLHSFQFQLEHRTEWFEFRYHHQHHHHHWAVRKRLAHVIASQRRIIICHSVLLCMQQHQKICHLNTPRNPSE